MHAKTLLHSTRFSMIVDLSVVFSVRHPHRHQRPVRWWYFDGTLLLVYSMYSETMDTLVLVFFCTCRWFSTSSWSRRWGGWTEQQQKNWIQASKKKSSRVSCYIERWIGWEWRARRDRRMKKNHFIKLDTLHLLIDIGFIFPQLPSRSRWRWMQKESVSSDQRTIVSSAHWRRSLVMLISSLQFDYTFFCDLSKLKTAEITADFVGVDVVQAVFRN